MFQMKRLNVLGIHLSLNERTDVAVGALRSSTPGRRNSPPEVPVLNIVPRIQLC